MCTLWIGNGHVVLPDQVVYGSVLIENGKIAALNAPCPQGAERVDAGGGYIMAGFIDIHVHGGGDADFMDESVEAFRCAARTHCLHGTTAIVPTTSMVYVKEEVHRPPHTALPSPLRAPKSSHDGGRTSAIMTAFL